MAGPDYIQQWQIVATLGEFGQFDEVSGGELDINITDFTPGGSRSAKKVLGTSSYTDLVLSRNWDPSRDASLVDWANQSALGLADSRSVTKMSYNKQGVVIDSIVYRVCKVKNIKTPDGKNGDNSVAMVQITLSVES